MKTHQPLRTEPVPTPDFNQSLPGILTMLLADHRAMRKLMKEMLSPRTRPAAVRGKYEKLKRLVDSHVAAEEAALLAHLLEHPKFEDEARESYEEHRVHEYVFAGIAKVRDPKRKAVQMQVYCEMLEHHLKEEEHDLFPKYRRYFASSTRRAAGKKFLKKRRRTSRRSERVGALRGS